MCHAWCGSICFGHFGVFAGPRTGFRSKSNDRFGACRWFRPAPGLAPAAAAPARGPAQASAAPNAGIQRVPGKCDTAGALGIHRTVEIDTTGGPGFGFEHFRQHDFLRDKEVVLTFDDGPWPTTPAVLKALADECVTRHLLPDRQARDLLSGNRPAGGGGRPHGRHAHLVAPGSVASKNRRRGEGRDREGHQRRASGRSATRARPLRSSASRRCAIRRSWSPISASATSRSSRPTWTRSTSSCASPSRS